MERFTALVVLVLGGLVLLVTFASVALGQWESTPARLLVLLLVLAGMLRAVGHLQVSRRTR